MKIFLFVLIFILHLFLRFYDIETRNSFGWDQVDNAWAAKNIIVDHKYPLLGMTAKGNSGFSIGPAYYYLISIFYFFTNLDPIASGLFAGVTSIFTFLSFFYIVKKLFSFNVALIAIFIHTISFSAISADRVQWPVNFIAPISLIVFYALYNVLIGKVKHIILLAIAIGFSFHIHFTSVFYPIIILFTFPFFPRSKKTLKYLLLSIPLFLIWLVPNLISEFTTRASSSRSLAAYVSLYYHGFHLQRMLQLAPDAFIEFESTLFFRFLKPFVYFFLPLFSIFYLQQKISRKSIIMIYLLILWFFVPWILFSVYSGEISNYYFSFTRLIAIMILAYLAMRVLYVNNIVPKIIISIFIFYYSIVNLGLFVEKGKYNLSAQRESVKEAISRADFIPFRPGDPSSYFYYIYTYKRK